MAKQKSQADTLQELRTLAEQRGVKMANLGNGHIQLQGPYLLVNYYPFSSKRTAYVAGTTAGVPGCVPSQAVAMACNVPKLVPKEERDARRDPPRKVRYEMLAGRVSCKCHWCPAVIDIDSSTIDHVIPLARGGLDNANNRVLACQPCNVKRGHMMPELSQLPASALEPVTPLLPDPPPPPFVLPPW